MCIKHIEGKSEAELPKPCTGLLHLLLRTAMVSLIFTLSTFQGSKKLSMLNLSISERGRVKISTLILLSSEELEF